MALLCFISRPPVSSDVQFAVAVDDLKATSQRAYVLDYKRIGMIGFAESKFRITRINNMFGVCKRYCGCDFNVRII